MKEQILKLRAEGLTYKKIKEQLGCSLSTISFHCGIGQKEKTYNRTSKSRLNPEVKLTRSLCRRYTNIFVRTKIKDNKTFREPKTFTLLEFKNHIKNNPTCYISGRKINLYEDNSWHVDHMVPLSKGGKTNLKNIMPVCKEANIAKSNASMVELIDLCKDILIHNGYVVGIVGIEPTPS